MGAVTAEMEAEIRLRYLEQGFVGMKPYPSMALKYDDDAFSPVVHRIINTGDEGIREKDEF